MKIFENVEKILKELSGVETITLDSSLQGDLALDSLHMVMLLISIEEVFDITLDETDMNPFELITANDVVNLVRKYRGETNEEES